MALGPPCRNAAPASPMPTRSRRVRPLAVFRLTPEAGSRRYVRVVVWPTRKACSGVVAPFVRVPRLALAVCLDTDEWRAVGGRPVPPRASVATVHFFRASVTPGVVAHELFHAALAYG